MKKYTITDKEWESVLDKVQILEKENSHLKGVIDGLERALTLYNVGLQSEQLHEKKCDIEIDYSSILGKDGGTSYNDL